MVDFIDISATRRSHRSDLLDITGQCFGCWTVESHVGCRDGSTTLWRCVCECGNKKVISRSSLISGKSKSCGCRRPIGSQWTIEQHRASKKKYRQNMPDYRAKESKRWRETDPIRAALYKRQTHYRTKYGLELEQVEQLLIDQNGRCAICQRDITLGGRAGAKVDHCHRTNKVRGVLCSRCNTALGGFKDDRTILFSAIAYLDGVSG